MPSDASHSRRLTTVRVGLDYRPALLGRGGIARCVRELGRALAVRADVDARWFGHSRARCRTPVEGPAPALRRWPIPGRCLPWLAARGLGADRLCGRPAVSVFHWTDYVHPAVSARARVVLTVHDMSFAEDESFHGAAGSAELMRRTRAAADRADHILAPTHATAAAVRQHLGVGPDRVSVIPFGVDHALRTGARPVPHPRDGQPFLLAVGTIEPRKNHVRLLEAWCALPADTRPALVVIGARGWECDAIVAALRRAQSEWPDSFAWHAAADDSVLDAHMRHATGVVYPSLLEGFGFPPLEALAHGKPVLAGDTPALREVCGDAALYCEPTSVDAIRAGLTALVDGETPAASIRDRTAARYRWSDCAAAHAEVYRGLAEVTG